ncbi:MAG: alpha/beta fold hydrolase [Planctomycetaceae bacterium]
MNFTNEGAWELQGSTSAEAESPTAVSNAECPQTDASRPAVRSGTGRSAVFRQGAASTLRLMLVPLGRHAAKFHRRMQTEERLQQGLVILLPGIDGCTTVSDNVARGLHAAGCELAMEVYDWRSFGGWNPLHLATHRRNRERASEIVQRILNYQTHYPDRPVYLIGHSAGAGVALFVLQQLPVGTRVRSVILLAAAVSRRFDVNGLLDTTTHGIWNFWSRGDLTTLGLGTMIFGTVDRRHALSAGALGFRARPESAASTDCAGSRLHEMNYEFRMATAWNFGGHFGCTNSAFVTRYVAPLLD